MTSTGTSSNSTGLGKAETIARYQDLKTSNLIHQKIDEMWPETIGHALIASYEGIPSTMSIKWKEGYNTLALFHANVVTGEVVRVED